MGSEAWPFVWALTHVCQALPGPMTKAWGAMNEAGRFLWLHVFRGAGPSLIGPVVWGPEERTVVDGHVGLQHHAPHGQNMKGGQQGPPAP